MSRLQDNRLCLWGSSTVGNTEQRKQCLLTEDLHQQLLAATKDLDKTEIARKSGVDRGTVTKILANSPAQPFHFRKVEAVLDAYGVIFEEWQITDAAIGSVPLGSSLSSVIKDSPFLAAEAKQLLSKVAGRDDLLRRIFEELDKGSSQSLVGEPLVGKTYLLKQICEQGEQRLHNVDGCRYLDLRMIEPGEFFPKLCSFLGVDPPLRGVDLQQQLSGKKYVLCLDEVDQLTDQECFSKRDRDQLCGLCTGKDSELTLVVASQIALNVLFPDEPLRSSPLVGLCSTVDVRPISLNQVEAFITKILAGLDVGFTQQQIQQLYDESRGKPKELLDLAHRQYQELAKTRG